MYNETFIPPYMKTGFNQFKFPGTEALTTLSKLNAELLIASQEIAIETAQAVMEIQQQYAKRIIKQLDDQVTNSLSTSPIYEKKAYQAETVKDSVNQLSEYARDISTVLVKSNERLTKSAQKTIKAGLDITKG